MEPIPEMQRVRSKRKRLHISQQTLATRAGLSLPYYVGLETGKRDNPSIMVLKAIERALVQLTPKKPRK